MSNLISVYRKRAGITQAKLAELCGWDNSQSRIGHYENGRRNPSLSDIKKIISILNEECGINCTFEDLFPSANDSADTAA